MALSAGRPWVYRGEIARVDGSPSTGDLATVVDARGEFVATAFYHTQSLLAARVLTRQMEESVDDAFFTRRLEQAWQLRVRLLDNPRVCRAVFAEADGIPGLVADRYEDVLVVQTLVAGTDQRLAQLARELVRITGVAHVLERNEGPVRRLEGLPERVGSLLGAPPDAVEIREGDVRLRVDLRGGQKTGHFLDQRENHQAFGKLLGRLLAPDGPVRVLDAFCHTGGFGLAALATGATEVTFLDQAAPALASVRGNAILNGFSGAQTVEANAFDHLRALVRAGEQFDAVVLDPPAFARGRAQLDAAYRGYKEINLRAMRLVRPGGVLCSCSCSQPVTHSMFGEMLADAAADAGRRVRVLEVRGAPPDHPGLVGAGETSYLKCFHLQMIE